MRQDTVQAVLESSTLAAQALLALLLGVVLFGLHRHYRAAYLLRWSGSWLALFLYLIVAAVARALAMAGQPLGTARTAASAIALIAGYAQLSLLGIGAWEISSGRVMTRDRVRFCLALGAVLALALVLASVGPGSTPGDRILLRYGVRAGLAAVVFFGSALAVWRARGWAPGPGRTALLWAFGLSGLAQVHQFGLVAHLLPAARYTDYMGFLDVALIALTGFAMFIGLLEEERGRAVRAAERIEHLAYHDGVTGRPNRRLFLDRLELALAQAQRTRQPVAVLLMNLDRFKVINDALGHRSGDDLLRVVAERLERHVRRGDTVARLAGDEFGVVLASLTREDDAPRVASTLLEELRRPFTVQGQEAWVSGSIGLSLYPSDGLDAAALLRNADVALRTAKQEGRDRLALYSPPMNARAAEQLELEASIRQALALEQFVLHYQPIVELGAGTVVRFEALVRWQHPARGLLLPGEFLPLAERIGLSEALDFWVLRGACRQAARWREAHGADVRIAVNISARPFQNPELVSKVTQVLRETGMDPRNLELEITETMAMLNPEAGSAALAGLRDLGVRVAIDDFGTGYSSLSYLRSLPVDALKIDRGFVRDLERDGDAAAVAAAVITLAHSLRMRVIAEGVETEAQRDLLRRYDCDLMQGFLTSPPLPPEACGPFLPARGEGRARRTPTGGLTAEPAT